jgi:putative tryptophan/tyrosine transport system substrate-binding protein
MRRRGFIKILGGAATWPLASRAQQTRKIPVVGVLWHAGNEEEEAVYLGALRKGLLDLGYVDGHNITLVNRFAAEDYARFNELAKELVDLKIDVLVAVTPPASLAAQRATSTIPVVFVIIPESVASKLVNSFARPGGNITGVAASAGDQTAKRFELLKDALGAVRRVAFVVNATSPITIGNVETVRAAVPALGMTVHPVEVREPGDIERAFSMIVKEGFDGAVMQCDAMLYNERKRIADVSLREQIPGMFCVREFVEAGGMMSYGVSFSASFYRVAAYVDKILKGEKPADIPVELPTKYELVINLKTAKALGLQIPAQLLARADEVIE